MFMLGREEQSGGRVSGRSAEKSKTSEIVGKLEGTSEPNTSGESLKTQTDTQVPAVCSSDSEAVERGSQGCTDTKRNTNNTSQKSPNGNQTEETDFTHKTPQGTRDHLCSECKLVRPDPTEKELIMYLHALRYKGPDFEYSTRLPNWAKEDWVEAD